MTRIIAIAALVGIALAGTACERTPKANASTVVDSVIPREEALRRFRADLPEVDSLTNGRSSRDQLVHDFVRALERRDTAALKTMELTKAEFGWLYYPTNPQGLTPYDLSPSLMWFMLEERSAQGLGHLLAERAGTPLHVAGYSCDSTASVEGDNRIYGPCLLQRVQAPGDTSGERLFSLIIERGGRFKFVSYANKL